MFGISFCLLSASAKNFNFGAFLIQHIQIRSQAALDFANTIIMCFRKISDTTKIYIMLNNVFSSYDTAAQREATRVYIESNPRYCLFCTNN